MGNGNGAPPTPLSSPYAQRFPAPGVQSPQDSIGGRLTPRTDDPGWQPPSDPLKAAESKAGARVIYREIPNLAVQNSWSVSDVRSALANLTQGLFEQPAMLFDSIRGDDRIQATMGSRVGGLIGRPVKHTASTIPGVDATAAAECLDAWRRIWPLTITESMLAELENWSIGLGFGVGQLLWDTSRSDNVWVPYIEVFHPRFTYYHWTLRRYVATTLDGQVAIEPGDGKWLLHAPYGPYRGWMRGAIRALAQPWLIRNYAYRDWARYSERHGMPIIKALSPAGGDPKMVAQFDAALATLGQESIIDLPQGVDKAFSYDLDLLEASDQAWQGFEKLIEKCEMSMVLAILHQNLTTQVTGGSFAAASIHMDVRHAALDFDNGGLTRTIYNQIARPFAEFNFGNADLAPVSTWDLLPTEETHAKTQAFLGFAQALLAMHQAGVVVADPGALARTMGIDIASEGLSAKTATSAQVFKYHLDYGVLTKNELRKSLGLPPEPDGDTPPEPMLGAEPNTDRVGAAGDGNSE